MCMAKQEKKIPIDFVRVSRIYNKIMKVLQKKTKTPIESYLVLKFGVAFHEISLGIQASDDSNIRAFIKEMIKRTK